MTVTSRLHRQKDKARQRKTEEKVERRPVVTPRYESGGEAQALVRPARDRGLPFKRVCMAGRGSHAWRPSSKLEPSNFCAKQARGSDAKGWTQGRRDGAAGIRCEIPGEADLQEDARLAASLVQMHTGSCG